MFVSLTSSTGMPALDAQRHLPPRLRCVPVQRIVGTVEPSPHFDAALRPASRHLQSRWERVAFAARRDLALPSIAVREGTGDFHVIEP